MQRCQSGQTTDLWMKLHAVQPELVVGDGGHQVAGSADHLEGVGHARHRVAVGEQHVLALPEVPGSGHGRYWGVRV